MEAVSHKAVCKYFVPALKFQMTHSDSVLAGIRPNSCLLEDPRGHLAQRLTDYFFIASLCGRQEQGDDTSLLKRNTPCSPLPARAQGGSFTHLQTVSIHKSKSPRKQFLRS